MSIPHHLSRLGHAIRKGQQRLNLAIGSSSSQPEFYPTRIESTHTQSEKHLGRPESDLNFIEVTPKVLMKNVIKKL